MRFGQLSQWTSCFLLRSTCEGLGRPRRVGRLRQAVVREDSAVVGLGAQQHGGAVGAGANNGVHRRAEGQRVRLRHRALQS